MKEGYVVGLTVQLEKCDVQIRTVRNLLLTSDCNNRNVITGFRSHRRSSVNTSTHTIFNFEERHRTSRSY